MKLATAKSVIHHHTVESTRVETLNNLLVENQDTIETLSKGPNDLRDFLEQAEAELSTVEENRVRLIEEIRVAKLKLNRPGDELAKAEQLKKDNNNQLAAAHRRLAGYKAQLEQATTIVNNYKQKELDRVANEIIDGALLMAELEELTEDQRVQRMKQIRHDKRVESEKEKGKHYHRMIRKNVQEEAGDVVMVPCHGSKCNFCPQKEVAKI